MGKSLRYAEELNPNSDDKEMTDMSALFHPIADELIAVASRLRCAAEAGTPSVASCTSCQLRMPRPTGGSLALAKKFYAWRRKRKAIFGNLDIFGEPSWDILLDLYIAQGECKDVSVSSACIGSGAPPTTGLRWLGVLSNHGIVTRENDPEDSRRVLVRLTETGVAAMDRFFDMVETTL
jgi:hypothetical protein